MKAVGMSLLMHPPMALMFVAWVLFSASLLASIFFQLFANESMLDLKGHTDIRLDVMTD